MERSQATIRRGRDLPGAAALALLAGLWLIGLPVAYLRWASFDIAVASAAGVVLIVAALHRRWPLPAIDTRLALALAATLIYGLASLLWSRLPAEGAAVLASVIANLVAAGLVTRLFAVQITARYAAIAAGGIILCALISLADTLSAGAISALSTRPNMELTQAYALTSLLFMAIAAAAILVEAGNRAIAIGLLVSLGVVIGQSNSQSAMLGLLAAVLGYGLARMAGRHAWLAFAAGTAIYLLATPALLNALITGETMPLTRMLQNAHLAERMDAWRTGLAFIEQAPLFGNGLGVSTNYSLAKDTFAIPDAALPGLAYWHPHNQALQVQIDLGLVGAALFVLTLVAALAVIDRFAPPRRLAGFALFAAALGVSAVNHSLYSGVWIAPLGVGFAMLATRSPKTATPLA